ncbi:MAG: hypothetical protein H6Q17_2364 [Bacteroidetes bacterium]|nr:hypothetical protein [Bacteroidota bacterium]
MKKYLLLISVIGIGLMLYFDLFHKPCETITKLKGKSYQYALNHYFKSQPNKVYTININTSLDEFNGGIISAKCLLKDSIVSVYTWNYFNHKKTIWVGKTTNQKDEIIDAIRYKNNVKF